jgi:cytochrome c biogenesis protein CcmG, thiol:disulfide interchange protein DsbE
VVIAGDYTEESERNKMRAVWLMGVMLAGLLLGCALLDVAPSQPSSPAAELLATVNGVRFTRTDLNKRIALVQLSTWLATGSAPSDLDESLYVDKWVDSELMAQAAAKAGVVVTETDAQQELARLLGAAGLDDIDLQRQLNLLGLSRDDAVQYERGALAVQRFADQQVLAGASEVEKPGRLATWLSHERGTAKIEKPTAAQTKLVGVYAGALAPNFKLTDTSGTERSLDSLHGSVVLVNFWATWCGPCRNEMPAIQQAYEEHKTEGLVVWGVNVAETREQVDSYAHELNLNFPLLLDTDSKVSHQYRVFGLPTSVFVGRDGVIREVAIGEMGKESLAAILSRALH